MSRAGPRRRGMSARLPVPLLLLCACALAASPAGADPASGGTCAEEVAARVQRHYDDVRDLSARFEQTTQRVALGAAGGEALAARGAVVFAKPGKMRWAYEAPEPSLVVSDGATLWIHDPAANEVQRFPVGDGFLTGAGLQFLLGAGRLDEEFSISARTCADTTVDLLLAPRREVSYERLELRVDRETGVVRGTTVVDLFGNRTTLAFAELQENTGPDAALFAFEPPAGARVLEVPAAP
jgi:outer membrane lipoprotein carrier protein